MQKNKKELLKCNCFSKTKADFRDDKVAASRGNSKGLSALNDVQFSKVKAIRSISQLMNANDDAINELLDLIDNWEALTGRPLTPKKAAEAKPNDDQSLVRKAKALIDERDWQYGAMPKELRHEPYVRILVILLIEMLAGKKVASKSVCIASGCPGTTALRYIHRLVEYGLVQRSACPSDGRVTYIELTSNGHELAEKLVKYRDDQAAKR